MDQLSIVNISYITWSRNHIMEFPKS
jgi:hypothetical protein